MMVEGIGDVAPKPWKLILSDHALAVLRVEAEKRAEYRQYKNQSSEWSKGLQGDVVIQGVGVLRQEVRPIFVGLIGEYAACEYINQKLPTAKVCIDLARRKHGDFGVDVAAFGIQMQVKTRQSADHGNLIRVIDERGNRKHLTARAFVFCEWTGHKTCSVLGWQWTKDIRDLPVENAIRGRHKNIRIADWRLLCMSRLANALSAKKGLSSC